MPSLTVKAVAEMLRLPALAQARILNDQKYPKQEPQSFRTPYYQPALTGIRKYFRSGNDAAQLNTALGAIQSISIESRRLNNARVLETFGASDFSKRGLVLQPTANVRARIGDVELRLSPELVAREGNDDRVVFLNCRAAKLDPETAIVTVEIAHWVLEQYGIKMGIAGIEYVDLFTGTVHRTKKRRPATTKTMLQNAKIITALWPTL